MESVLRERERQVQERLEKVKQEQRRSVVAREELLAEMLNMLSTSLSMLSTLARSWLCRRRGVRTFSRSYQARPPPLRSMIIGCWCGQT